MCDSQSRRGALTFRTGGRSARSCMMRIAATHLARLTLVACITGPTFSCGNGLDDETVRRVKRTAAEVCACDHRECAEAKVDALIAWGKEHVPHKPSPRVMRQIEPAFERLVRCQLALAEKDPPPDTEPAPPTGILWAEEPPGEETVEP